MGSEPEQCCICGDNLLPADECEEQHIDAAEVEVSEAIDHRKFVYDMVRDARASRSPSVSPDAP